jgi:hypothetical protein
MFAKIKQIHSPDVDFVDYWPEDKNNFGFLLELSIGTKDSNGMDIFQLMVCTPDWFKAKNVNQVAAWGYSYLFVFKYDFPVIMAFITKHIEKMYGDDWTSIAAKIDRYAMWEFQDYQP